ncbi:MAG TPA: SDR family NAD(P)-dependent oxidoreductase [Candidatus Thermoplasmatota archaeon]|nr:SDR family NAD(P)-dependent oxidoreductase [Candidatus Thermoplasmatota archaeon]
MDVKGKRILVTGGAGFIGSHVVDRLVAEGAKVTVLDNLSGGKESFLQLSRAKIAFVEGDCGDAATLDRLLKGTDSVWHLAANPDVRSGESDPDAHYEQNVHVTYILLEAMRRAGVKHLVFTSTSTVYGAAKVIPTPESYGPLLPISVYGACKLACEAIISSYAGTFGMQVFLFRFANVVGPRSTHGVIFDFTNRLRKDPKRLEILGDGTQTKSYVSVADTVDAMVHAVRHAPPEPAGGCHVYNIGSQDAIPVTRLADIVEEVLGVHPKRVFSGGTKDGAGWKGDVKNMGLDLTALSRVGPGWKPRHGSAEAVRITAQSLAEAIED